MMFPIHFTFICFVLRGVILPLAICHQGEDSIGWCSANFYF